VLLGVDHELRPNLAIGAAYTYRRTNDWPSWNPRIGMTSADYSVVSQEAEGPYSAVVYAPNAAKIAASGGGRILMNRPDYHSNYQGLELTLNKRLSNKWFARVAFSLNNWNEHYDGPGAVQNPTRSDSTNNSGLNGVLSGPQVEGGQIAPRSSGSGKGDIFYNARWQLDANGFYQLPAGFEIGANLFARQGYVEPLIFQVTAGGDGRVRALGTATLDEVRYPNLWDFDLRLAKTVSVNRVRFLLSADAFNVLNSSTTLAQSRIIKSSAFGAINEILSPRIVRLGVKFQF
jgi:hypothetical protein